MNLIVRVLFAGLIGFVPLSDGSVRVIIVDAREKREFQACESHAHEPLLVARQDNVVGGCERSLTREPHVFCVWPLSKVKVSIHGLDEQGFERLTGQRRRGFIRFPELPEAGSESVDFSWLADMDAVTPDGGKIIPELLSGESNKGIVGRMNLSKGTLSVCHLVETCRCNGEAFVSLFEFKEQPDADPLRYKQALADLVLVQAASSTRFITVYREGFDGSEWPPISLKIGDDDTLDLLITNLPRGFEGPSHACDDRGVDFSRFFQLVQHDKPGDNRISIPYLSDSSQDIQVEPDCDATIVRDLLRVGKCRPCENISVDPAPFTRPICPMAFFEP